MPRLVLSLYVDFETPDSGQRYIDLRPIAYAVVMVKRLHFLKKTCQNNQREKELIQIMESRVRSRIKEYGRRRFNSDRLSAENVSNVLRELYDLNLRSPYGAVRDILIS